MLYVFVGVDKLTSVFIHFTPAVAMFCWRWHYLPSIGKDPGMTLGEAYGPSLCFYMIWQLFYYVKVGGSIVE